MKYISLFSGIGAFEQGIQTIFPFSECLGFSEIDPYAIQIYTQHFPTHKNLGDITKITKKQIKSLGICDLIVAGFPCTNLSSMANFRGNNKGINGPKSGLFFDMIEIIKYAKNQNPNLFFIIENNNSMRNEQKKIITEILKTEFKIVYNCVIDNSFFGLQSRKRVIWSNFPIQEPTKVYGKQTWQDVLEPTANKKLSEEMIKCLNTLVKCKNTKGYTKIACKKGKYYWFKNIKTTDSKSRWDYQPRSDTQESKTRPIISGSGGNIVIIRYNDKFFIPKRFSPVEIERLFGYTDNYTNIVSSTRRIKALSNSIPVFTVEYILNFLPN